MEWIQKASKIPKERRNRSKTSPNGIDAKSGPDTVKNALERPLFFVHHFSANDSCKDVYVF